MITSSSVLSDEQKALLNKSLFLEKWPLARLISIFEDPRPHSVQSRHNIISFLEENRTKFNKDAFVVGFTGTPGVGKSSLISVLCQQLLSNSSNLSIAILAVDPSSSESGGALLGDRTRIHFQRKEKRLFFRSQASNLEFGGITQTTFHVFRFLKYFFDFIFIETVGIGQSEIEVQHISDHLCLVMQPLLGDQVQFMKAGIMEVPDTFIINKCDEKKLAETSYHLLKTSLGFARIASENHPHSSPPIFLTSASTQHGIEALADFIIKLPTHTQSKDLLKKETFYCEALGLIPRRLRRVGKKSELQNI